LLRIGGALSPSTQDEAVAYVAARLREIASVHGPGAIAFLGGEKLNVEEAYLFQKLARSVLGTNHVDARTRFTVPVPGDALLRATGGGRPPLTFEQLVAAQEVLVLGEDLQGESPFAQAQLVRGQHQRGLHLTVAHPRRVKLARPKFRGAWLGYRPGSELALVHGLTSAALESGDPAGLPAEVAAGLGALRQSHAAANVDSAARATGLTAEAIRAAAGALRAAERKAILFGRGIAEHAQAPALLRGIENLAWVTGALAADRSSVMYMGPHHDSQGALDMGLTPDRLPGYAPVDEPSARAAFEQAWGGSLNATPGMTAPEILAAAAEGKIKALWIVADQWLKSAPDRARAEQALARAELVIVNELFLTETAQRAHVVFPVAAFAEKEGVAVNCERRLQRTVRALPRRADCRADWEVFQNVAQALGAAWRYRTAEDVFREIARVAPGYRGLGWASLIPDGVTWAAAGEPLVAGGLTPLIVPSHAPSINGDSMALLSGGTLFLHGSLSYRGALLPRLAKQARALLNPGDAQRLAVLEGDAVSLEGPAGAIALPAGLDDSVPPGSVFVPYAYAEVELNRLGLGAQPARVRVRKRVAERVGA
jgi:predicted molibdopterin-dependent oxidoreductase YjgC